MEGEMTGVFVGVFWNLKEWKKNMKVKKERKIEEISRGMILKIKKTIISMLFKQSCVWGEKIFSKLKNVLLKKRFNLF